MHQPPPGPGWWRAADGQFHPPDARPAAPSADAPGAARPVTAVPMPPQFASDADASGAAGVGIGPTPTTVGLRGRWAAWPRPARVVAPLLLVMLGAGAVAAFGSGDGSSGEPPTFVAGVTSTRAPATTPTSASTTSTSTAPTTTVLATTVVPTTAPSAAIAALVPVPTTTVPVPTTRSPAVVTTVRPTTTRAAPATTAPATTAPPTTAPPTTAPPPTTTPPTTTGAAACAAVASPPTSGARPVLTITSNQPTSAVRATVIAGSRTTQYRATTDTKGRATLTFSVSGAADGSVVTIEVTVGDRASCRTTYTVV